MKVGDHVYILSGLEVEEWRVYEVRPEGAYGGPWIKRSDRLGQWAGHHRGRVFTTLDEAVAASRAARERAIKRCARELERMAINTNVKVRLMKPPKAKPQ